MGIALKKANKIFRECGSADPLLIAEYKDYVIVRKKMPCQLKGFTLKKYRMPVIYINDLYSKNEQDFTCLHEIGHIVCGHDDNAIFLLNNTSQVVNRYENEADDFACALKLLSFDRGEIEHLNIKQISALSGIDEAILLNFFKRNRTNIRGLVNGGMYE
ncbi:ImmA/IrrE family metallo-endopeptidase [Peptoniphilus sp. HCN-40583]|uniref:ImmA/IrrE family metallo-endopeptidase n=1 Tax=Peptoniphilus sp. HCN-40583 TaxID=3134662 RepID=UPI0030BE888D